jgi:hypothetical protein
MKIVKLNPDKIKCNVCGKYFDPADLGEVFDHEHSDYEINIDKKIKGKKVDEDRQK